MREIPGEIINAGRVVGYFDRTLTYDVEAQDVSVHYECLQQVLGLTSNPGRV